MDRLLSDISGNLPQVFLEPDTSAVQRELDLLKDLSETFRSTCKVCFRLLILETVR